MQGLFNGLVVATLIVVLVRYIVGATRGGLTFATPVRMHLAVLGGLFLLSVAFGYQLDKYELVYSTRGVATGVSYTDQNAQFFAFDLLTVVSGLAAAFLVGGALTRQIWPLGLTLGVWFLASIVIGRIYPEAVQRFSVLPNQFVQEERYIANNIAMTRLAFDLGGWEDRSFRGDEPVTQALVDSEEDTFRNARLWDYRPLKDTLDQLQTVRRYYTFHDVDTDRYLVNDVQRQVMLSARELAIDQNPSATGWVNQRIVYTHGIGVGDGAGQRGDQRGPAAAVHREPAARSRSLAPHRSPSRASTSGNGRRTTWSSARSRPSSTIRPARATTPPRQAPRRTGRARPASSSTTTLMRLLFSLRFRDLDLLISDQVTGNSQLLFHRSLSDRIGRIAPFLRYDKDPYLVVDGSGRLVYVQDAYTTSDRFPNAQSFDPTVSRGDGHRSVRLQLHPQQRQDHCRRVRRHDALLRRRPGRPDHPRVRGGLPDAVPADRRDARRPARSPARPRGAVQRPDARVRALSRHRRAAVLPQRRSLDGADRNDQRADPAVRGVLRRDAHAGREQRRVPAAPADGADQPAEHDRVGRRPQRRAELRGDPGLSVPGRHDGLRARADRGPDRPGPDHQPADLALEPVGQQGHPRQPHRRAAGPFAHLPPAGLPPVDRRRPSPSSSGSSSRRPGTSSGVRPSAGAIELLLRAEANSSGPLPSPTPGPSPSPGASPTPTPSSGPVEPLPADVAGLIAYANLHFDLAQAALRDGDFARYGEEIERVQAALDRLDQLAPGLGLAPGASPSPAP